MVGFLLIFANELNKEQSGHQEVVIMAMLSQALMAMAYRLIAQF